MCIRAEQHVEAEKLLRQAATQYPSQATEIAIKADANDVRIVGWPEFNARVELLCNKLEKPITAAWLLISNYTDDGADGLRHPVIELGYLHDGRVSFSNETVQSLLSMCVEYPAPWTGSPDADGQELEILGLGPLNDLLVKRDWDDPIIDTPAMRTADAIAEWFLKLHFHRAVHRELNEHGLVRDIPLIVGSHDVGPWCTAIYQRSKSFLLRQEHQPHHLLDQEEREKKRRYAAATESWIEEITKFRDTFRGRHPHRNQIEFAEARLAMIFKFSIPMTLSRQPWEMNDAEFAALIHKIRYTRDPDSRPPLPPSPSISGATSGLVRRINATGFGRKRS